ncbi:alanine racemase [Tenacibaculum maritimum]|uniref:alanine racemase n=1 Tax=Tenacibaculum maritimum TaxID=107401 RepID=UPI0012E5604E|nr:alanine racemase [Tenacibaculum maritimum]CAA0196463.1 Alanine racemase [Tenacibaculum maritimum]
MKTNNNHVTVLEIDGKAIKHNLNYFKQKLAPTTKILVVVKAFGYGSEAIEVAKLVEDDVDYFAVAYANEGIGLREGGVSKPILVLHPQVHNFEAIIAYNLEPSLYSFRVLKSFLALLDEKVTMNYPIHIKFNTGLNRLGFLHTDIPIVLANLKNSNNIRVASIFSHLAASEDVEEQEFTVNQINTFAYIAQQVYKYLEYEPMIHVLNTSGIVNYAKAQFDMVRLGIGLYGFANDVSETTQLKNTHRLTSIISQIHSIMPGETVGYNRVFVAKKETRTATVPIGHADGIPRSLGAGKGHVVIHNQKAPIIGNVCMDMIMVDVTKIDCKEGDQVIVFDSQKRIHEIAVACETIPYEVLTAISQRVKRFVKN